MSSHGPQIVLRFLPPAEILLMDGKSLVGVVFNCQLCGARVRMSYHEYMVQACPQCRRSPLAKMYDFAWLPHTQRINERNDIR